MIAIKDSSRSGIMTADRPITSEMFADFIKWIDRSENTARAYIINLRQFAAWMAYRGITRPTRADVIQYRDWLQAEHTAIQYDPVHGWKYRTGRNGERLQLTCKPNTAAQYLRSVSQFFAWASSTGLYPNVAENIRTPKVSNDNHRKDALTPSEVLDIERSIEAHAKERDAAAASSVKDKAGRQQRSEEQSKRLYSMYLLTVTAGLRTIEISRANVQDLEVKGGQAWLYIWGKGRTEPDQKKPVAHEVYEALRAYLDSRTDSPTGASPLFVSTGNRSHGKRIAPTTISSMLKGAMVEAGYNSSRLTAHSLRHTAGTAVQGLTGDLYATQRYMRHANPATTEIYLHNNMEAHEADIAQRLYDLYHQKPQSVTVDPAAALAYVQKIMDMRSL